ncbi:hypothetical protein B0T26DRAFT_670942 [Lasiosphaeria miniovina]|uniref:Rhodopsin domain-containing protein n=1 Tax=Lasiosphaeria miniovina TaxID=1954250 RepID=A0AA40BI75_9PEZI|nr:uncharacterized protein B0T26DRAFT_670942 [Lasiosphaeria miniovina]KAK0734681.1 hypothetical protein B0T26DRAFT_670942 [Lasiosphaeria miniovina]
MGSVSDSPPTLANFSPDYIASNEGPVLVRTCIALSVVSALTVAVRFAVRWRSAMGLGWDDWLILAALPHLFSFAAMAILSVEYGGVGRHLDLTLTQYLFVSEFNYFTLIAVIKASILVMYCRIFPSRFMKKGVWVIGVFVGCKPIDKFFRPFMKEGMCLDTTKLFVGNSIINIISDIMILALPTHEVWRLQVPRPQKLAIWGVFILGFLRFGSAVVMTCIRLKSLINLVDGQADFTPWIWTLAEPTVGLVTASLPTMRPLLRFVFGMTFSGRRHHPNVNRNPNADANNRGDEGAKGNNTIVTIGGGSFSRRVSLGLLPGKLRAQKPPKQASKSSCGSSSSNNSAAAKAADDMARNQDQRQYANRGPYDRLDEESQLYDMTPTNTAHTGRWPTPLASNPAASAAATNNYFPAPEPPRYGGAHVQTVVYGARKPSVAASDEIPLDGISVTHDLRWAESRGE